MGTGKIVSSPEIGPPESQVDMVPIDDNEMSWVVGMDTNKKGNHDEETIDQDKNMEQKGENVAAKI